MNFEIALKDNVSILYSVAHETKFSNWFKLNCDLICQVSKSLILFERS